MTKAGVKCVNSAVQQIFIQPNPGVGGTLIFSYIRWLGPFFGGVNILKFNFLGGFSEK